MQEEPSLAPQKPSLAALLSGAEVRRFLKFLVVGAFGFVVDTGALTLLALVFSMNRIAAKGCAFLLAVISNFIWNRLWTYQDSRSKSVLVQAAQFVLVSVVGLGINMLVFGWADHLAHRFVASVYALYIAQVAAVGVALMWNFVANRFITYSDVKAGS